MSFPAGIVRVFSGSMAPPVLSFRLLNAGAIEQFLPNAELLYRYRDAVAPRRRRLPGDARAGWGMLVLGYPQRLGGMQGAGGGGCRRGVGGGGGGNELV